MLIFIILFVYKKVGKGRKVAIACALTMTSLAFVSALLVVSYSMAVCASHDTEIVVITASQLREEIKSQLNETQLCSCGSVDGSSLSIAAVTDRVKAAVSKTVEDLLLSQFSHLLTPGYSPTLPATSCKEILQLAPQSPSGLYWIRGTDNGPKHMYCDMERSCKGVAGGWMRLASIDMTDASSNCPSGLKTLTSPRRMCAMNINGGGCSSAIFAVQGVKYSRVCGKIIGYQQKSPDAFHPYIHRGQTTIDSHYVDGISLTHGTSPRQHIWTFAAALHEYNSYFDYVCPCTNTRRSPPPVPDFVGHDYFCDTGSENHWQFIFYEADPLWDGAGCGPYNTCCSWNSPPWFLKNISPSTSDDIEMRMCADQARSDEDINFKLLEIYVQ